MPRYQLFNSTLLPSPSAIPPPPLTPTLTVSPLIVHSDESGQFLASPAELAASPIGSAVLSRELGEELELDTDLDIPIVQEGGRERVWDFIMDNHVIINTFIAGGLAGAASRTVVSPLERLKIILQVQASSTKGGGQVYNGIWSSLGTMWKEEGFRGFMKGNGINVVRIIPYSACQFVSYGAFKNLLRKYSGSDDLSPPLRLTAGAGAGIASVALTYPLDLVRARLSIATANMGAASAVFTAEDARLGIVGMTKKVYKNEGGVRGLYRGCWATAVGVAPYVSLNFYIYETLKSMILPEGEGARMYEGGELVFRKLLCGGLAGGTSLLFTHPFDVLRRKLQVAGVAGLSPQYSGAIDALTKIIKAEGFWKGMYRGLTPNIIKVAPSIAVSFYTFETVRDFLSQYEEQWDEKVV